MVTLITEGVEVSVESVYRPELSEPGNELFMFAYRILIKNLGSESVQLLRRYWYIFDSTGSVSEVAGEGVVGQQPVIGPGETHEYMSGCSLKSDMGYMQGKYLMVRELDGLILDVEIPRFQLMVPYRLN